MQYTRRWAPSSSPNLVLLAASPSKIGYKISGYKKTHLDTFIQSNLMGKAVQVEMLPAPGAWPTPPSERRG